jgi:hypothetical protein
MGYRNQKIKNGRIILTLMVLGWIVRIVEVAYPVAILGVNDIESYMFWFVNNQLWLFSTGMIYT